MKFLKNKKILDIAEGDPQDAQKILNYLKKVGSESNFMIIDEEGVPLTVDQEKKYLEDNLDSSVNKTFVGKVEDEIVSVCGIHGSTKPKIMHNVTLGISVLKDYWNVGVGTHMMNHLINYCRMTGFIKNISLEVREDNEFAIRLYKGLGFKKCGSYSDKFKIDGKFIDCLIMELQI